MTVTEEILGQVLHDPFLDPEDNAALDRLLGSISDSVRQFGLTAEQLGISRDQLREKIRAAQPDKVETTPPEPIPASPQRTRQELKRRLNERAAAVAGRLLKELKLSPAGRDIGSAIKKYAGQPNTTVVNRMMNAEANTLASLKGKKQRGTASEVQLRAAYDGLDAAGDRVATTIRAALRR